MILTARVGKFSTGDRILLISSPSFMWYIGPPLAGADVSRPPVLLAMPTFASSNPRLSTGLDVLAAAAAASEQPNTQPAGDGRGSSSNTLEAFNQAGPFNPVASLPTKLVKWILNLEFVDMSEVTVDDDTPQAAGRPHPARLPVTSISQWLERFAMMAAIKVTRFPLKAPELFAYQALIVRAQRNYEGEHWVTYDRQFRREALARQDLNWSVPDSRLYQEAFTGRTRSLARCSYCLADDHTSAQCSRNPNRPQFLQWLPELWQCQPPPRAASPSTEICRRFNEGRCKVSRCKYWHACSTCQGPQTWRECSRSKGRTAVRGRSPVQNHFVYAS